MSTQIAPPPAKTETITFGDFAPSADEIREHAAELQQQPSQKSPRTEKPPVNKFKVELGETFEEKLAEFKKAVPNQHAAELAEHAELVREKKPETKPAAEPEKKPEVVQKAPEITPEASDEDLEKHVAENTKTMPKPQRDAFRAKTFENRDLKRQHKALADEKAALATELATLRAKAPDSDATQAVQKELDAVRARMTEQEAELAATRYEKSTEYEEKIKKPLAQLESAFKQVATDYELNADDLLAAASLKGKERGTKLAEMTVEMSDYDRTKFYGLVDRYSELRAERELAATEAKTRWDSLRQQDIEKRDREAAERTAALNGERAKVWEKTLQLAPFLAEQKADAPGAKDWNDRLQIARNFADHGVFDQQPAANQVEIMQRAAVQPLLLSQIEKLTKENTVLLGRLGELRAATPSAGGDVGARTAAVTDDDEGLSFTDLMKKRIAAGELVA